MNRVVVFDFDGTLTRKDTMLEFVSFVVGKRCMVISILLCTIPILLMKLRVLSNEKVKSLFLYKALGAIKKTDLVEYGNAFADQIDTFLREDIFLKLMQHLSQGDKVYVVSASVDEWVRPWCVRQGIEHVLCTRIKFDDKGRFSGYFATKNCYGPEKVTRFLAAEPARSCYHLTAYGDSRGDKEMILLADKGFWV